MSKILSQQKHKLMIIILIISLLSNSFTQDAKALDNELNQKKDEKSSELPEESQKAQTSTSSSSTSSSNSSMKDLTLSYIRTLIDFSKSQTISLHNLIKEQLNIAYPFDLVFFLVVGVLLSSLYSKLTAKSVRRNCLTFYLILNIEQ